MAWIGVYGLVGLLAVALAERFMPVLPSYGLLLSVGIGAVDGDWSLSAAFLSTVAGSMFGCAAWFYAVRGLGDARSSRRLKRAGQIFGMPIGRVERGIASVRRNQVALAFALQLVPTVRLVAPALAALSRSNSGNVLIASAAGIAVWNRLFVGIGFYASRSIGSANTTVLAVTALGCLLVAEAFLLWIARRVSANARPERGRNSPLTVNHRC